MMKTRPRPVRAAEHGEVPLFDDADDAVGELPMLRKADAVAVHAELVAQAGSTCRPSGSAFHRPARRSASMGFRDSMFASFDAIDADAFEGLFLVAAASLVMVILVKP
jgi:hypothetical protein